MKADKFSISGFYRWKHSDEKTIHSACADFSKAGTRFLAVDAITAKSLLEDGGYVKQIAAIASEYGLTFRDAHAPWGATYDLNEITDEARFAVHETILPLLAESGIKTYTFHIGTSCIYNSRTWFGNEDQYRSIAASALERLLKSAERCGITLAVENCFEPSTTAQEAMALVKKFPSPYLGLCLDCGHANLMEPMAGRVVADMVGYIQSAWKPGIPAFTPGIPEFMAPEIVTVHIHDNDGLNDKHAMLDEQGTIDWKRIAGVLSRSPRLISLQSETEIPPDSPLSIAELTASFQKLEIFLPTADAGSKCQT